MNMNAMFLSFISFSILSFPLHATEESSSVISHSSPRVTAILGYDDRVPSNDPRIGRFVNSNTNIRGGTGWLMACGCLLTAGHVETNLRPNQIEFNVPLSEPHGTPLPSRPEDIYDISLIDRCDKDNSGNDWAVYKVNPNNISKISAFENQKSFFRIIDGWKSIAPSPLVRVSGYGDDETPPGRTGKLNCYSRTLQTDTGILSEEENSSDKNIIKYLVDTANSNSGSPVYLAGTHLALAIHTTALRKEGSSYLNAGTGFKNNLLTKAIKAFSDVDKYVDSDYFFTVPKGDGSLFKPYRRLEDALESIKSEGGKLGIVSGYYPSPSGPVSDPGPGISFPKAPSGKKIEIKALAGKVHIGRVIKSSLIINK